MDDAKQPHPAPVINYYGRSTLGKLTLWAFASPFVAIAAFILACILGISLINYHPALTIAAIVLCSLGSIAFCIVSIRRVRNTRGGVVGTLFAGLAICFSLGTGLLCPGFAFSLRDSRHIANSSLAQARMRKIVQACISHADANSDAFPPHLAVLLAELTVKPDQLLDNNASVTLLPFPESRLVPPAEWRTIAADVDAHSDLTYIGADLKGTWDTSIIVLYTKPGRIHKHLKWPDEIWDGQGRIIAFADGHAELVVDADIPAAFAASNAARAELGLPPLTLDGPPP